MLTHGFSPSNLLSATIIPIPKDKRKSLNNSTNYRGIALSSVISKVLDLVILNTNRHVLDTCELQFGFKSKHSTTQCTYVINEIVQYYINNDTNVFVMMLDCSKAFDRVHYVKLFSLLSKKGLCPLITRLLAFIYTNQSLSIKWANECSDKFSVSNGAKQGGILSPILFTVYIDELFIQLKQSNVGCYVGDKFMGAFGYADDSTILAPTLTSLKLMLRICDEFGKKFNVLFNVSKYQFLDYCKDQDEMLNCIHLNGNFIKTQQYAMHLGHPVGQAASDVAIEQGTNSFVTTVNGVLSYFSYAHIDVKYKLFKIFCMPLYGCILWDFWSKTMKRFCIQWRKCLRKLLNLSPLCHSKYLPLIVNDMPLDVQLYKRFIKFICNIINSDNSCVSLCGKMMLAGSNSIPCRNLNNIAYSFKIDKYKLISSFDDWPTMSKLYVEKLYCEDDYCTIGNIKDLLYIRDNNTTCFKVSELDHMITNVCTN